MYGEPLSSIRQKKMPLHGIFSPKYFIAKKVYLIKYYYFCDIILKRVKLR